MILTNNLHVTFKPGDEDALNLFSENNKGWMLIGIAGDVLGYTKEIKMDKLKDGATLIKLISILQDLRDNPEYIDTLFKVTCMMLDSVDPSVEKDEEK